MDKYNNRGLTGLANIGNTCFINSFIQSLSHTYEFNEFLDNEYLKNEKSILLNEWDSLRKLMWAKNCSISPKRFIYYIYLVSKQKNAVFQSHSQEDVSEFAYFLLDVFNEYLRKPKEYTIKKDNKFENFIKQSYKKEHSVIIDLFYGVQVSKVADMKDQIINEHPEMFSLLNIHILRSQSVKQLIEDYCKEEHLTDENRYAMPNTNQLVDAKRSLYFYKLPKILIIVLKRFTNITTKINVKIELDEYLNLEDLSENKQIKYELYSINSHSGGLRGGHYTSTIKNNKKWYQINDISIRQINFHRIKSNSNVYCLFYRKIYS